MSATRAWNPHLGAPVSPIRLPSRARTVSAIPYAGSARQPATPGYISSAAAFPAGSHRSLAPVDRIKFFGRVRELFVQRPRLKGSCSLVCASRQRFRHQCHGHADQTLPIFVDKRISTRRLRQLPMAPRGDQLSQPAAGIEYDQRRGGHHHQQGDRLSRRLEGNRGRYNGSVDDFVFGDSQLDRASPGTSKCRTSSQRSTRCATERNSFAVTLTNPACSRVLPFNPFATARRSVGCLQLHLGPRALSRSTASQ